MNEINGKTRLAGLIGNPVSHTLSPFIHNRLSEALGVNLVYVPLFVEPAGLEKAIQGAQALHFEGLNVTVPYKLDVMSMVDVLDERARKIEAVNTLKFKDGQIFGYNTDADGLLRSIQRAGVILKDQTVCILGAGGAARSVAVMCAEQGVKKMMITNRTISKAAQLAEDMASTFDGQTLACTYDELMAIKDIDICFQTTSVGLHPNVDASPISSPDFYGQLKWAVDLIYNPSRTRFLQLAEDGGAMTINGLGMLFFQAVKAYEIWNELTVPIEISEPILQALTDYVYLNKG